LINEGWLTCMNSTRCWWSGDLEILTVGLVRFTGTHLVRCHPGCQAARIWWWKLSSDSAQMSALI
jgi:hypothetical protein